MGATSARAEVLSLLSSALLLAKRRIRSGRSLIASGTALGAGGDLTRHTSLEDEKLSDRCARRLA